MTRVCTVGGLVFLVGVLVSSPASAQSVLSDLTDARASYPTPMTAAQIGELLTGVAVRHPGFVLLRKDAGNHCPTPMSIFVACDILVDASSGQGYDVLRDQEGAGAVQWALSDRFPADRFVSPVQVPTPGPISSPPPSPVVPTFDFAAAFERLYQQHERIYDDETNQRTAQTATLKAAIDEPGFVTKIFGNRYVQLALAGLGTYLMTAQVKP